MADSGFKIGAKVQLKDKGYDGLIRFMGVTSFAPGKWVGVELFDRVGKNNGLVQGKEYFNCPENCGVFVRQNQLVLLSSRSPGVSRIPAPSSSTGSHIPTPTSSHIPRAASVGKKPGASPPNRKEKRSPAVERRSPNAEKRNQEAKKTKVVSSSVQLAVPLTTTPAEPVPSEEEPIVLEPMSDEASELQQRLLTLQQKRTDDKTRIKELEKYKAQFMQMMEYKQRWSESQTELQQQLKAARKEVREAVLAQERAEEEMRELSDTVEMATLDKEMAEERGESLQSENEVLKEKIEELTIDLEIIKQEINETGIDGAAATAQYKQLEQQNSRLKDALVRLRDLSAQDKLEHQRMVKDLEKNSNELNTWKEHKEKVEQELQEADAIIDELKEQVDAALGAEEMVEKLTDKNLELEEKMEQLAETVADLEALRDLSEEQEELRLEVEHELREELDLSMNNVRQSERKVEASQESIIDQQQTIEKFRVLVQHLQADVADLRERGERSEPGAGGEPGDAQAPSSMMNISLQLSSAIKAQSRTIDFELRKLDAQQASEHINLLKSFMPNSFLISGGDYDALLVLMLLPRLMFKSSLIIDQLKQQHKLDEALGSLASIASSRSEQLSFVSFLVYKLSTLQMLVGRANSILGECDVQLYRVMGGVRDDLYLHEKALDILIELLKKEQLDESVPLHGVEKAITHFEHLLEGRLRYEGGSEAVEHLLRQVKVTLSGCDYVTMELLRLRTMAPEGSQFMSQVKELESFNSDLRQACRKIRRKVPAADSQKTLKYDSTIAELITKTLRRQLLLAEAFKALQLKAGQRANSLSEGERLTSGELEEFTRQVVACGTLQELGSELQARSPQEKLRSLMSESSTAVEKFLTSLQEGDFDAHKPRTKTVGPVVLRARSVKAELSDVEGLGFKLEERQQDILELKMTLKMKSQELSEAGVKIGLLEKKVELADGDTARKVEAEREEVRRYKAIMEEQERKYNKTIEILQADYDDLENEKIALEKQLTQHSKKSLLSDITVGRRTLGGRGSPYSSPFGSPFTARKVGSLAREDSVGSEGGEGVSVNQILQTPLLLAKIESLKKAFNWSQDEVFRLKAQIAKAQLNSLRPLNVPKKLFLKKRSEGSEGGEGSEEANQTDQEKSVLKRTANLINDLKKMSMPQVVDFTSQAGHTPREQLTNHVARIYQMQQEAQKLKQDVSKLLAGQYTGGLVSTKIVSFTSPQFSKVLSEGSTPSTLAARLWLSPPSHPPTSHPPTSTGGGGGVCRLVLSPEQFRALHTAVLT